MVKDNGGPAFPQSDLSAYGMGPCDIGNDGMSLRDWFAGMSLNARRIECGPYNTAHEDMARLAYADADAMLAARKDTPDEHS